MKYLRQMAIIAVISFLGEGLNRLLPLPIPGSIYGLVLLLLGLVLKLIPLEYVKDVGHFLISIMPIMFIGPTVGLMASYEQYRSFIVPFVIISMVSTVLVMAVTGCTAQAIIRRKKDSRPDEATEETQMQKEVQRHE